MVSDTTGTARTELAALLAGYSIEVTARDADPAGACAAVLAPRTSVYVAFVPGARHERVVQIAAELYAAGFVPVPHLVARSFRGYNHLVDHLTALRTAGVASVLVIGGDADAPAGPYGSALELLQTGAFARAGIRCIGLACYPEPHRRIDRARLEAALDAKLALVAGAGMEAFLVSQFCLEAAPIVALADALRQHGITAPLRVGVAGPTDRRTLWKYAMLCGVGASIRVLGSRIDVVRDLLIRDTPEMLVLELAKLVAARPLAGIVGLHIFSFGGVGASARWANEMLASPARPSPD